ncbi:hypothetical protein [Pseudobdellovibrio sp. HCB154]|uniref:hypothetical protein n=1 Tax=Pseudobdellovibrio sp. HCB154 TaxID=3386277 RepID=UPI003917669F
MKKQLLSHILRFIFAFVLVTASAPIPTKSFAQTTTPEADDSFDPFSDYNEFEQETDEEADIHFLRNGRYLTLGLLAGYRGFTKGFAEGYDPSLDYGVQFSYFFDLNLAAALSYTTADHAVFFQSYDSLQNNDVSQTYSGTVNIQIFDIHLKYYINTDNVTKGLADLNPYLLVGTGMFVRTYNLDESFANDPDKVVGFRLGGGIEIPMVQRRFYIGAQALYNFVQFPDENNHFIDEGGSGTPNPKEVSPHLDGDIFEVNLILGTNF